MKYSLSIHALEGEVEGAYGRWVRWGVGLGVVGYVASLGTQVFTEHGFRWGMLSEGIALLSLSVALALAFAGRTRIAAALGVGSIWLEIHTAIVVAATPIGAATSVIPVLVVGTGLLLGGTAAMAMALGSAVSLIGASLLGQLIHGLPLGFAGEELHAVVLLSLTNIGAGLLVRLGLNTFETVLDTAQRNERLFADLFDRAPDGIISVTPGLTVEAVNPAAARILGRSAEELLGRPLSDLRATTGEGLMAAIVTDDTPDLPPVTLEIDRVAHAPVAVEVTSRRVARADGEGYQLMLRDVTDRRAAEEEQKRLEAQLTHAQKMEAVGLLAGGVAHDFNNILTVVSGYADLLEQATAEDLAFASEELRKVHDRGTGLTRQLLAFARREMVHRTHLDLAAVVEEAGILLRRLCGEQVTLGLDLEPGAWVLADRGQLEQVLVNLVANARDASPPGSAVTVAVTSNGGSVDLVVRDQGVGMNTDTRARIFEPFFTTKPRGKGTGLGLSTVHGIAEQNDAELICHTAPGRGTTFVVRWPVADPAAPPSPGAGDGPANRGEGRILVAEDDEATRGVVVTMLERAGYLVVAAAGGDEALALYDDSIDLVLTDVVMPEVSGVDLAERLRKIRPDLPLLYMSGHVGKELFGDKRLDPGTTLLSKPFRRDELLDRVRAAIDDANGRPR